MSTLAVLAGIAVPYNRLSLPLPDGRLERFLPGAFHLWLRSGREAHAYFAHRPAEMLGTRSAGTLRLRESAAGLEYECDVPDTSVGHELLTLVKRLDVRGVSIAFKLPASVDFVERVILEGSDRVREIRAAMLTEISFTPAPYYPSTTIYARPVEPPAMPGSVLAQNQEARQREAAAQRRRSLWLAKAMENLRAHQLA